MGGIFVKTMTVKKKKYHRVYFPVTNQLQRVNHDPEGCGQKSVQNIPDALYTLSELLKAETNSIHTYFLPLFQIIS